jgi:DNA (cytosine-5)-methyltransferase 1
MKLGSLFDGIGGFPLGASRNGIMPVWASEIEPFPIKVTKIRFPDMVHVGDITKLNGAELPPVDIISGGSPCQDLSVAGKRAGLAGARSGLFMEQIRLIKEMRQSTYDATGHIQPRYMVWENVPGAFSSNKGEDFRAVLEETARVAEPGVSIPMPANGKWKSAGAIVGDGYSISWRTFDAQYWGVPQRRRRIYLIADFGGESAPEILFKREGLSRHIAESGKKRQGTAGDVEGGAGETVKPVIMQVRGGVEVDSLGKKAGKGALLKIDKAASLSTVQDMTLFQPNGYTVRRLTPLECERLQGYQDGWTDIPSASDSARYKALGNSVAIPCVEYVMEGIKEVMDRCRI